jgi:hypothetical protein
MAKCTGRWRCSHIARQRHHPGHRDLAAPDQPNIGDGVMGRATRTRGHQGDAGAGEAGDAMSVRGPEGLGEGHPWQEGGEPPGQHRRVRPPRVEDG